MSTPTRPLVRERAEGTLLVEVPRDKRFAEAVQHVFYPDAREVARLLRDRDPQVWIFWSECYEMVASMVEYFWPGQVVDLINDPPQPVPVDDLLWNSRWSEYKTQERVPGGRQRVRLEDLLNDVAGGFVWGETWKPRNGQRRSDTPRRILFVTEDAPWDVIQAAYRALSKTCHPDRPGADVELFRRYTTAYETLEKEHRAEKEAADSSNT